MVQFIIHTKRCAMDDLGVGRRRRIHVDRRQIVRRLDGGAPVQPHGVEQLFALRPHRLLRRGIAWPGAELTLVGMVGHVRHNSSLLSCAQNERSTTATLVAAVRIGSRPGGWHLSKEGNRERNRDRYQERISPPRLRQLRYHSGVKRIYL